MSQWTEQDCLRSQENKRTMGKDKMFLVKEEVFHERFNKHQESASSKSW